MYCWQQLQHQYEQFINAFLSLKAQFDPGLRCSYLNTMGDYHSPPARGTMETIPPSGHVIPPKGCLMLPEGRCRPNVDVIQRRDKAARGQNKVAYCRKQNDKFENFPIFDIWAHHWPSWVLYLLGHQLGDVSSQISAYKTSFWFIMIYDWDQCSGFRELYFWHRVLCRCPSVKLCESSHSNLFKKRVHSKIPKILRMYLMEAPLPQLKEGVVQIYTEKYYRAQNKCLQNR